MMNDKISADNHMLKVQITRYVNLFILSIIIIYRKISSGDYKLKTNTTSNR